MSEPRPDRRLSALMWYGVTGAPLAVALHLVSGVLFADITCKPGGDGLDARLWTAVVGGGAALIALGATLAAVATVRATRQAGEAPPLGRVHFLGLVGIVVSFLLLAIIVMTTIGALILPECVQS